MQGQLRKMTSELMETVRYQLALSEHHLELNPLLSKNICLVHSGGIYCIACAKKTAKSFNQGYCYPCFIKLAQCDLCIMKPEKCHFAQGTCREPEWGRTFCFQPHIVYLANSSGLKVGITRQNQMPTRWIDQGAVQALPILKTESRHVSGLIEVSIAKHISDKTSWQKMLKSQADALDLLWHRQQVLDLCKADLEEIREKFGEQAFEILPDQSIIEINYPIDQYPEKVKSLCFIKTPKINGVLQGIKGQYLLLDSGVLNLRKYTGFEIEFSY